MRNELRTPNVIRTAAKGRLAKEPKKETSGVTVKFPRLIKVLPGRGFASERGPA